MNTNDKNDGKNMGKDMFGNALAALNELKAEAERLEAEAGEHVGPAADALIKMAKRLCENLDYMLQNFTWLPERALVIWREVFDYEPRKDQSIDAAGKVEYMTRQFEAMRDTLKWALNCWLLDAQALNAAQKDQLRLLTLENENRELRELSNEQRKERIARENELLFEIGMRGDEARELAKFYQSAREKLMELRKCLDECAADKCKAQGDARALMGQYAEQLALASDLRKQRNWLAGALAAAGIDPSAYANGFKPDVSDTQAADWIRVAELRV